ncbi:MAG: S-layer homology domain-containing protein [Eubacteriales bacterium]
MKIKKIFILLFTVAIIIVPFTISVSAAFTDVPEDHPYKEAIDFCKTKGFVIGETATTFMPDFKLTRAHFAIIWCRSLNIKDDNHDFTDITELRQYFDGPAIMLNGLGLFLGTSDTLFSPDDYITREQLAVITMRTYNLGVADPVEYQKYADHASISDWARNGVSSCLNARVFRGLYTEENFKPNEPVTRAEICKLIYNLMPTYKVTIGEIVGGTITASSTKAHSGVVITLTITPDAGKQLKAGTLKYNDISITDKTFIMPAKNVTITAEFEDIPLVLETITVKSPNKTTYLVGENLDLNGMVVTATYTNNTNKVVTEISTITPAGGSTFDTAGSKNINVSYTEDGITKTTSFDVQVNTATTPS